jgi:hypothetical protein
MATVSLKLVFSKSDTRRVSLRGPVSSMFDQLTDHVKAILLAKVLPSPTSITLSHIMTSLHVCDMSEPQLELIGYLMDSE